MFDFKPNKNKHNQPKQPTYHPVGKESTPQSLNEKFNSDRRTKSRDDQDFDMDGFKHQLAKFSAVLAWVISIWFSYLGFKFQNQEVQWIGWVLGFLITCGEFIFNTELKRLSLTLVAIGVICYAYGIYSNVVGFWSIQFPTEAFPWFDKRAAMSWFVGAILEIYPEAAFAWGMRAMTGDLVGNLASLASGVATGNKRTYEIAEQLRERLGK